MSTRFSLTGLLPRVNILLQCSYICVDPWDVHGLECGVSTVSVDKLHVLLSHNDGPDNGAIDLYGCLKFLASVGQFLLEIVAGFGDEFVGVRLDFI